jgi:hypothetical protein
MNIHSAALWEIALSAILLSAVLNYTLNRVILGWRTEYALAESFSWSAFFSFSAVLSYVSLCVLPYLSW